MNKRLTQNPKYSRDGKLMEYYTEKEILAMKDTIAQSDAMWDNIDLAVRKNDHIAHARFCEILGKIHKCYQNYDSIYNNKQ